MLLSIIELFEGTSIFKKSIVFFRKVLGEIVDAKNFKRPL